MTMFEIYNTATNARASVAIFDTVENAWAAIDRIIENIANGNRSDLAGKNFSVRTRLTTSSN